MYWFLYIKLGLGWKSSMTKYPLCSPMNDYLEIFQKLKFYLLYLLYYIYKNIPTSIIQGCWFQIWYLFFQVPCGFQLIKSQSCQKVVYTGPTSEVFYTIFLYCGNFSFFLKMIVVFWSFLPWYYFFLFLDIFWVINGFIRQGWGRI